MSDRDGEDEDRAVGDSDGAETAARAHEEEGNAAARDEEESDTVARDDEEAATDEGQEWRFSLEDIEQRNDDAEAAAEAERRRNAPLEAGDPSLENALFVLLGVVLAILVFSRLFVG